MQYVLTFIMRYRFISLILTFEPNEFVHGLDKTYWNSLIKNEKKPLANKALSGLYPPGSTIKTLVALSALEIKLLGL